MSGDTIRLCAIVHDAGRHDSIVLYNLRPICLNYFPYTKFCHFRQVIPFCVKFLINRSQKGSVAVHRSDTCQYLITGAVSYLGQCLNLGHLTDCYNNANCYDYIFVATTTHFFRMKKYLIIMHFLIE